MAAPAEGGAKLFVGGVAFSTSEETLAAHFAGYGDLTDCFLMADKATGRPRGFGFVTFADAEVAQRVAAETHVIDGRQVDVKVAVPKELAAPRAPVAAPAAASAPRSSKIFVGGLAPATTEEAFRAHFAPFGAITDAVVMVEPASRRPRGFGFVTFSSDDAVDRVFAEGAVQELAGKRVEIKRAVPREELPPPARNGGAAGSSLSAASPASRAAGAAAARRAAAAAGEPDAFTALMAHHAAVGAMHPAAAAYTVQLQALMAAAGGGGGGPFGGPYGGPYGSPYGGDGDAHWGAMAGLMGPGGLAGAPLSPPRHGGPFGWGPGSPPHGAPGGPGYEQAAAAQFAAAYAAAGLELPHGGYGYGAARLSPYAGGFVPNVHAAAQSASRAQYQQAQAHHHQAEAAPTARDTAMMIAGAAAAAAAAAVAAASEEVPSSYLDQGHRSRNGSSSSLGGRGGNGGGSAPGSRRVSVGSLTQRGGSNSSLAGAGDDSCAGAGADDGPGGGFPGALSGLRTALLTAPGPYY